MTHLTPFSAVRFAPCLSVIEEQSVRVCLLINKNILLSGIQRLEREQMYILVLLKSGTNTPRQ